MKDAILSYRELCDIENQIIQRGMNFRLNAKYSVILMSQRGNAPYNDKIHEDGLLLEYEGHDIPKSAETPNPKTIDQPELLRRGGLTQNGLFKKAAEEYRKTGKAEIVRVYEKLFDGVWSDKGFYKLENYKIVENKGRKVFRFFLRLSSEELQTSGNAELDLKPRNRIIPTDIKKRVWERDNGQCVICGAKDELHFDHDLPYSKGGTSISVQNVRILCARHNLEKSDKIE